MSLIGKWFGKPAVAIVVLVVASAAVYSNTLRNPFVFDDNINIVDNAKIRDLGRFWPPSGNRWLGDLTFGLNYAAGGLDVTGYHTANIAIHIANTLLLYALLRLVFRTPLFHAWRQSPGNHNIASTVSFLCAALFAVHPLQTQAVTYIIQRFTSLATMFYILSLALYLGARLAMEQGTKTRAIVLYTTSLLSAVLAMKTKEIAFTLPLAVCLVEVVFFSQGGRLAVKTLRTRLPLLVPFLLTLLIIPAGIITLSKPLSETIMSLPKTLNVSSDLSRHDYFLTQFAVILTYLRLLAFPINQSFDYLYPVIRSWTEPLFLLAAAGHLLVFCGGAYLLFRSSAKSPLSRLAGFGVIWFYLALSVESSVIPISDVIFEHRAYLPGAGILISFSAGLALFFEGKRWSGIVTRGFGMLMCMVIVMLGIATFERNTVWQQELTLWQDVVAKNPYHARGHSMIGVIYKQRSQIDKAVAAFQEAIRVKPDYAEAHVNLGSAYVIKGQLDEGLAEFLTALGFHSLDKIDTAALYMNIAYYHIRKGTPEKALNYLRLARDMTPEDATVHYFFAMAYDTMGNRAVADEHRVRAHQLNPEKY